MKTPPGPPPAAPTPDPLTETVHGMRALLGAVQELILVVDAEGRYRRHLRTRYGGLGSDADDVTGQSIDDFLAPAECARLRLIIGRVLARGEAERAEYAIGAEASERWFEAEISAIPDLPGNTLWVVRETTVERRNRLRMRLQSAALEAAANGIVITDTAGSIVWVNPAFSALTGYTAAEAIGRNPRDLVRSGRHDRAYYQALWQTILSGQVWRGSLINRRRDGSLYEEDQTITPLLDANGQIRHFIAIKQDVSERNRGQRRLQLLNAAIEAASDGVLITDAEGQIVWLNPGYTRITGYGLAELIGKTPGDLVFSGQSPPEHYQAFWATLRSGQSWQGEMINRHKDGRLYTEAMTVTPVFEAPGRIGHYVAFTRDISEEKRRQVLLSDEHLLLERLARGDPLSALLEQMARSFQAAVPGMLCSILLLDEKRLHLSLGAAPDLPAAFNAAINGMPIGLGVGSCGTAAATGETVIAADIANDPNWEGYRELAASHGLGACWSLPLRAGDGRVLGTFAVYFREPRAPSENELADLRHGADLAGLVMERKINLRRLRASEQRFALAMGAAGIGVWSYQVADQAIYCSPLLKQLLGYADDELHPTLAGWTERTHPDDRAAMLELIAGQNLDAAVGYLNEHRLRHRDGSWHWFLIRAAIHNDADGTVIGLVGTAEDVTERKETESLQAFLGQHRVAEDSGQFFRELGAFLAGLLGAEQVLIARVLAGGDRARTEAWFCQGRFPDPIDYPLAGTPCQVLMDAPVCSFSNGVQQRFPDDPLLAAEAIESYVGIALNDSRGKLIGLLTALSKKPLTDPERSLRLLRMAANRAADLLERQMQDERITASEQTFRSLFEEAADSILLLKDGRFIDCNNATLALLGHADKAGLLGKTPPELSPEFQPDGRPSTEKAAELMATALENGYHRFEWDHLRADGSIVPVEVSLTAVQLRGETVLHTAWRDISARRKAEAALRRAMLELDQRNHALQDFAFVASHDLQEPLRKIRTFSDLLLSRPTEGLDAKARDYLQRSSQAAARMQALIDDLLVLSRLGAQPLRVASVALDPLIDR
ncbi:MAG: PAS domain S-box protein, partial [Lysobacterales bacterium]